MPATSKGARRRSARRGGNFRYELKTLADHEKAIIREAMERLDGNVADCARALGVAKSTMYEKLYTYGLRKRQA